MGEEDLHHEYTIAVELYKGGDYENALRLMERIAEVRPGSKHVMYTRALCLIALGRIGEARAIRDQLSGDKGGTAKKFTKNLDAKLREKQNELEKTAQRTSSKRISSISSISSAQPYRSFAAIAIGVVVIAAVLIGGILAFRARGASDAQASAMIEEATPFTGNGPDQYVEAPLFLPSGRDASYRFAIFLAPAPKDLSNTPANAREDSVAGPAVSDWAAASVKLRKALGMSNGTDEPLNDMPRDTLLATAVMPRAGIPLSGKLANKSVETFAPGNAKDVKSVIDACGKPERSETWSGLGSCVGLTGEVQWWGRVGLAADAEGKISHVLLQAYPGDER